MPDPIHQELDIPNREMALKRLELLQQNILRLREEIPDMSSMAKTIKAQLTAMDTDTQTMLRNIERLLERQATWQEWLAGRLTLLANLKHFLEMNDEPDDPPWDELPPEDEEGA